jgi:hypothetical protein
MQFKRDRRGGRLRWVMKVMLGWALVSCVGHLPAREFSLVAYNVENLFDIDGVSIYGDYGPENYGAGHLAVKLRNIATVLREAGEDGTGPELIVLNEIELDQTPVEGFDREAWLEKAAGRRYEEWLEDEENLPEELRGAPVDAWLAKALEEEGLGRYEVVETDEKPGDYEGGRGIAIRNLVLSKFPVREVRSHPTLNARAILEVVVDIDGHPLTVFANHWKSGAGNEETEKIRVENARVLRARLDELLAADAQADIVIAGDLNSHYNQGRRYRSMKQTGIGDILRSQGNELAIRGKGRDLYNLWFELPSDQRGSDTYQNEWGTLMHIILTRGLYDHRGVQYVDNSFRVLSLPGLNADRFGRPVRWQQSGKGFSDHFPLIARFRVAPKGDVNSWMALTPPYGDGRTSGEARMVDYNRVDILKTALDPGRLPQEVNLQDGTYDGRFFRVRAPATLDKRGVVRVDVRGQSFEVYTYDRKLRETIRTRVSETGKLGFYGELGTYRGRYQFLVHGKEWLR